MTEEVVYISVVDGKASNLRRLHEVLYTFNGNIEVVIRKKRVRRSDNQNKYFHVLVHLLAREIGYSDSEMKEIIKAKFLLSERVIEKTGELVPYIKQTHLLSKEEFAELIDSMIRWAADMAIVLPAPNTQLSFI